MASFLHRSPRGIIFASLIVFLWVCFPATARSAKLTNIVITNSKDDLLISLKVEGAFAGEIKKAIDSGVPTTFSFFLSIEEVRRIWTDKVIAEAALTHTIKYNNLKNEYKIVRSWEGENPIQAFSFEDAQKMMTEIQGFRLTTLDKLVKGRRYQLRAKAKLSKITLPFYFHYILLMASAWEFETDWYTIEFVY